jgi:hypothetical protein
MLAEVVLVWANWECGGHKLGHIEEMGQYQQPCFSREAAAEASLARPCYARVVLRWSAAWRD